MSKRHVFGRREVEFEGRTFIFEMREDGVFVRVKRSRLQCKFPFAKMINHAKQQPEFFYSLGPSNEIQPVPDLSPFNLVHDNPEPESHVHESGEQQTQTVPDGGDGLPALAEWGDTLKISPFAKLYPNDEEAPVPGMPTFIGPLEVTDPPETHPEPGVDAPCEAPLPPKAGGGVGEGTSSLGIPDERPK